MANREKKITIARKQTSASPLIPPKENEESSSQNLNSGGADNLVAPVKASKRKLIKNANPKNSNLIVGKLKKGAAKTVAKKTLALSFKGKAKKPPKINQKLAKALINNVKKLECKKATVIRNGVKTPKGRKTAAKKVAQVTQEDIDDAPPVLEPILPLDENLDNKKSVKRINRKTPILQNEEEIRMIKEEDGAEQNTTNVSDVVKSVKKTKPIKKTNKTEIAPAIKTESIEDVMNDLSYLITKTDVKSEPVDELVLEKTESNKKTKRTITRKSKLDLFKKRLVKQENIENILSSKISMDPSAESLIDMLDLNVTKVKNCPLSKKRRHSIEKFPLSFESSENSSFVFSSLPRCRSPKAKRTSKIRQSCEIIPIKRASPYSTRADSPARILRNGKHRKLKDTLLDGLDSEYKKRRRLCSDYSGSEKSVSKVSGYDSDSSFSDLASLIGNENVEMKDNEVVNKLEPKKEATTSTVEQDIKPFKMLNIESTMSTETTTSDLHQTTDTNSNLFEHVKVEPKIQPLDKKSLTPLDEDIKLDPATPDNNSLLFRNTNCSVPEKEVILDIMKQTFNDVKVDEEKRTTRSSARKIENPNDKEEHLCMKTTKFYGISDDSLNEQLNAKCKTEKLENVEDIENGIQTPETSQTELKEIENNGREEEERQQQLQEDKLNVDVDTSIPQTISSAPETTIFPVETENDLTSIDDSKNQLKETKDAIEDDLVLESRVKNDSENENNNVNFQNISEPILEKDEIVETPEDLAIKENILQALGLQSLKAAEEAKQRGKVKANTKHDYTGTLKTVIKLNRCEKKKNRGTLKMTLQKNKNKGKYLDQETYNFEDDYTQRNIKEGMGGWRSTSGQTSDTAGAHRKCHYSNRSNIMDGSSEHTSDGDTAATEGEDSCKVLVIPEKASSFSIHPGRLCKDECSYCFGKFGLFDTPCHIAQMKTVERQDRILATEKHLTRDSCLCDACYRHVDRKSNTPSYTNKSSKRSSIVAPGPRQNHCHVLGCNAIASNILRRKWIIKMRKNVCQVINIDLDNPGLHSIPICEEHFAALEHLMVCAMCKRRLARNHIHYLGPEVNDLNDALLSEGVPIKLSDKPIVCKLCRYFASLILKRADERPENSIDFFKDYKRRLLHFNDLEVMDGTAAEEPIAVPTKEKDQLKKKKKVPKNQTVVGPQQSEHHLETEKHDLLRMPSESTSTSNDKSRSESPTEYMVDYNTLVPSIAMECGSDIEMPRKNSAPTGQVSLRRVSRPESVKEAVEISKNMKLNSSNVCIKTVSTNAVQRLGSNPSISVRQLFPGEEELGLQANIEFNNVKERTPEGWEKCISTIQYDLETKQLWQDLQKPYGNLSSFLRHLILLEKYYRNGDLILSANATSHSINYSESVQNRLRAYDNIPTNPSMLINVKRSSSGIITTKEQPQTITHTINAANIPKNIPITLSQITSLSTSTSMPTASVPTTAALTSTKQRNPGLPPGLISLHPGTTRPVAPLVKVPQTQKIKIPLTKNWRPNLIPIDPNKKTENDKRTEYVKVISGGKPYYITIEDYHRICAIKRSCDLKQKRLQEAAKIGNQGGNSVLKQIYTTVRKTASVSKSSKNEPLPPDGHEVENSLKKLDETVEKLESKLSEPKSAVALPKIPKSLTVIPQTVSHKSSSPITQVTQKNKNVPSRASS